MYNSFNVSYFFKDRQHAGKKLGLFLKSKYEELNPLIFGIPRGGVEVAYYVAQCLHAELSVLISKKLPFPGYKELGFGAVAEEYSVYVSPIGRTFLSPKVINQIIEEQVQEINRRVETYRQGKPLPEMSGRTVILVDDGIAMGVTLVPVLKLCRKKGAAKIIIAAPVSGTSYDKYLDEADALEILVQPQPFYGVGQAYERFRDLTDEEVQKILLQAEVENSKNTSMKKETKAKKKKTEGKELQDNDSQKKDQSIRTDFPLSEKDEVKEAEERTKRLYTNNKAKE